MRPANNSAVIAAKTDTKAPWSPPIPTRAPKSLQDCLRKNIFTLYVVPVFLNPRYFDSPL